MDGESNLMQQLLPALTTALGTLLGSLVTLWGARRNSRISDLRRRLVMAYEDIAAFHHLESRYTEELAKYSDTANAWKLRTREAQRDAGISTPSPNATAKKVTEYINRLSKRQFFSSW